MNGVKISIVCPTLNEEKYVEKLIQNFLTFCPQPSELFFVDAGSTDGTVALIDKWTSRYSCIKLLHNRKKFVSNAFNLCFPLTTGRYVALLGAHTSYPTEFFIRAYETLEKNESDVVGGPLKHVGRSPLGKAIAHVMSTRFGVGGTEFRTSRKRMYVDSVAFAVYKRAIFEKVGLFDEALIRNQDDEMHYRMNAANYKILMEPDMECTYYVREALGSLVRQYFQYGLFKPLVLRKVKAGIRIRHIVPSLFVLYLCSVPFLYLLTWYILAPLISYIAFSFFFSALNNLPFSSKLRAFIIYPILHLSYGIGFLTGLSTMEKLQNGNH